MILRRGVMVYFYFYQRMQSLQMGIMCVSGGMRKGGLRGCVWLVVTRW